MTDLSVLRVFLGPDGRGGNPLGVVYDGGAVPIGRRQAVAADLGFAETVFVDDPERGAVEIYTPSTQLPFAGHPLVGTAWLLRSKGVTVDALRPPAGEVPTWEADGCSWIRGRAAWALGGGTPHRPAWPGPRHPAGSRVPIAHPAGTR